MWMALGLGEYGVILSAKLVMQHGNHGIAGMFLPAPNVKNYSLLNYPVYPILGGFLNFHLIYFGLYQFILKTVY